MRRLVFLIAVVLLVVSACGSDDEPSVGELEPPSETTGLREAVAATLEEGSAAYSVAGTPGGAGGEADPDAPGATRITGRVDFSSGMRELVFLGGEAERRAVLDQEHLFFQRNPADQGVWRKAPIAAVVAPGDRAAPGGSLRTESLVALHDPTPVLSSLADATGEESSEGRHEVVLSRSQVGGMLAEALARLGLEELVVTVQVETERVVALQYHLQPAPTVPGEGTVRVAFESFGFEEFATPAEAEDIEVVHLRSDLRIDLGLPGEATAPAGPPPAGSGPGGG